MDNGVAIFPTHDAIAPVHWLPSAPSGPVERALDRYEAAIAAFHGE
jgi:hypothetical protein